MKIRKIKVVTIHGQTFTPKQLKEHHKELAKLDKFDIEEYEKNLPNLNLLCPNCLKYNQWLTTIGLY